MEVVDGTVLLVLTVLPRRLRSRQLNFVPIFLKIPPATKSTISPLRSHLTHLPSSQLRVSFPSLITNVPPLGSDEEQEYGFVYIEVKVSSLHFLSVFLSGYGVATSGLPVASKFLPTPPSPSCFRHMFSLN